MTGQILAGQSTNQAAAYQLIILFLITSTACSTVQLLSWLISHALMNMKEHRLQTSGLVRKETNGEKLSLGELGRSGGRLISGLVSFWRPPKCDEKEQPALPPATEISVPSARALASAVNENAVPTLKVDHVLVERANIRLSLSLSHGERIGITGSSGIGKTQLLRTLVGLEHCEGILELDGTPVQNQDWPEWRRQVCWVSQDRPTLEGTPRAFYEEILKYHSQKQEWMGQHPEEIAGLWGVPVSAFDRPWAALSGGEAQRASLAIALSLHPKVLLLDEAFVNVDEATKIVIETSLVSSGIPIILVSHSSDQLNRFCTHHIDLKVGKASLNTPSG